MTDILAGSLGASPSGVLPPQALEAERAVLAALMMDPEAVGRAVEQIEAPVFYRTAHQKIFSAIVSIYNRNEKADLVTLAEELRKKGELEMVGGPAALTQIAEHAVTAANIEQHLKIIREKSVLRALIHATREIQQESFAAADDTAEILDRAEQRIFEITDDRVRQGFVSMKELMLPTVHHVQELKDRNKGQKVFITGVASGFPDIDAKTAGFQRGDLVIIAGRPSMGKCLAEDSELVLDDGSVATIAEVFRRRDSRVASLRDDLTLDRARPSHYVDDGMKPAFEVRTRLGRRVETTWTHPFLTLDGWKPLGQLVPGDHVAVPRRLPVFGTSPMRECEIKLLAYLIGDGGLTGSSPRFTTTNPAIERDFTQAVREFGGCGCTGFRSPDRAPSFAIVADPAQVAERRADVASLLDAAIVATGRPARALADAVGVAPASVTHWRRGHTMPDAPTFERVCSVLDVAPEALAPRGIAAARHNAPNPVTIWLRELGIAGCDASAKHVPAPVFRLPAAQLATFLRHLFATDGWACVLASGQAQIGYSSVSERLARQVAHLLLRFGVIAKLRQRWVRYRDTRRSAWQVDITDRRSLEAFATEIGIFGKEPAIERVRAAMANRRRQTNVDLVPVEVWRRLDEARGAMTWAELARRAGVEDSNLHAHRRAVSRSRLARFAAALGDTSLAQLAASDVYWDRIESITPVGTRRVYDLTIPDTHNFVANDVCVHNTSFALNIAENAAIHDKRHVAILSLEMSKEQLALRLLCSQTEVPLYRVRSGNLSDAEFQRIPKKLTELYNASILIDDTAAPTVLEIRAKCRRLRSEGRLDLVMIDYLQLIRSSSNAENRVQEISQISRSLKALAKELDVPVLALSQLSRAVEQRTGKDRRPQLSDLRESGALEQDADLVMFVFREEMYNRTDPKLRGKAEIIIAKQRNGPTGDVPLTFRHEFTQFVPYTPVMEGETEPDMPYPESPF